MGNLDIYEKYRAVPENATKPIKGGRLSGMTDINPMWRIKCLTEAFGPCGIGWFYNVKEKWLETVGTEIVAFVEIELYVKNENEWSKPIIGSGGSKLATQEKSGVFVSDECYKMAITDALSVACKQLGIGADIYWQSGRSKYSNSQETPKNTTPDVEEKRDPSLINSEQMGKLRLEMLRTGATEDYLCKFYKVDCITNLTSKQWENAMANFKKTPDRKAK